ncbi:hypothetical protein BGZ61DRAFT_123462 [Ilyonectria robusta]|uniref:uncharacterized protein n=1 Tax=Ilyonectria robusta TaxID=1079257 RepID=UPI001E8D2CC2|nr:uncharacterized protein BGZ61DRAFT_123462 [Ilyonectria robusta]KAH8734324.1 hypothetical protein BGZ61DRAFT_123462 [Ilyonectria robusta]
MPQSERHSRGRIRVRVYESPVEDPMPSPPRNERTRSYERTSQPLNSNGARQENRSNPYPAPPIYGQRNDDPNYSYNPAYNSGNPFAPNPQGYNPNGYDPRFQYHSTNVYLQPPYTNPFPQAVPPFAPTPPNPLTSRYNQGHFPHPDHAYMPSPQYDSSPNYPTAPRNVYYGPEYQDIASSAGTVGSPSMSSTSSMERDMKRFKKTLRKVTRQLNSARRHEDIEKAVERQLSGRRW